jgi:hypothetical protein
MKRDWDVSRVTSVKQEGLSLTRFSCKFIISIGFCFLFTSLSHGKTINICIDENGNTVFTDNACPAGYKSKNQNKTTSKLLRKDITPSEAVVEINRISWEKYQIALENIEMNWQLTRNPSPGESILHPQVEFTVHNSGENSVIGLKIIMLFMEDSNRNFGDTFEYIKDIPGGSTSQQTSMHPTMGYVYTGFNEDKITSTRYKVDVYARYNGDKEKIATLNFFSKITK